MTNVNNFLDRVRQAGWKVEQRPHNALTPEVGDIATSYGDPTAYHVEMVTDKAARLQSDEGDITVWVNPDHVTVAARLRNGIWRDVRPHLGPHEL